MEGGEEGGGCSLTNADHYNKHSRTVSFPVRWGKSTASFSQGMKGQLSCVHCRSDTVSEADFTKSADYSRRQCAHAQGKLPPSLFRHRSVPPSRRHPALPPLFKIDPQKAPKHAANYGIQRFTDLSRLAVVLARYRAFRGRRLFFYQQSKSSDSLVQGQAALAEVQPVMVAERLGKILPSNTASPARCVSVCV